MQKRVRNLALSGLIGLALPGLAASAGAESDPCREWRAEHRDFEAEVVHATLTGASESTRDAALFELLQREAWLSSCEQDVSGARVELMGWRLVDRPPEEFSSAVLESLLERGGFDVSLRGLLGGLSEMPGPPVRRPGPAGRQRAAR